MRAANLLLRDGEVAAVLDLDEVRTDHRVAELAQTSVLLGTLFRNWRPTPLPARRALLEGYERLRPLSGEEQAWLEALTLWIGLASIPAGDAVQPWIAAIEGPAAESPLTPAPALPEHGGMLMTSRDIDPRAVLDFIIRRQQAPGTACAYLGTEPAEIRADLEGLDQHWLETLRVSSSGGRLLGAAVIEWDEELDRSWVHGPWLEKDALRTVGPELLAAVTAQAPVSAHEMYADVAHDGMAWLAEHCGWRAGEANFEYSRTSPVLGGRQTSGARAATGADEPALRALHEREFPGTYASASELLGTDGTYSTSVIDGEDGPVGYVSWQLQGEAAVYVDFLAVRPGARRKGIGQRLIAAAQEASGRSTIALTVDEHRPAARAFYAALGFELTAATRPYRLRIPGSPARPSTP